MGTMLTLESLRQLYARNGDAVADKIGAVVPSPDIDMDVFSSAVVRIGPIGRKITVVTATNDRALALSGRLASGMTRVGAAERPPSSSSGCASSMRPTQVGASSTTICSCPMRRCGG